MSDNFRAPHGPHGPNPQAWPSPIEPSAIGHRSDSARGDGLENGLEAWFGTHPGEPNGGLALVATDGTVATLRHPQNPVPPVDVDGSYRWFTNLIDWYAGDGEDGPPDGPFFAINSTTWENITTVTLTSDTPLGRAFVRATASLSAAP